MMKYKVGDKVRVRKDLKCGEWYTNKSKSCGVMITEEMSRFIGNDVTIIGDDIIGYRIKEDEGGNWWPEFLFEGANEAPSITKRINEKHNILNGLTQTDDALTEKFESQNDSVNHPSHYTDGIECYKYTNSHNCNFNTGNIIKYATRYMLKGNPIQDMRKVQQYAEYEIERLKEQGYKE